MRRGCGVYRELLKGRRMERLLGGRVENGPYDSDEGLCLPRGLCPEWGLRPLGPTAQFVPTAPLVLGAWQTHWGEAPAGPTAPEWIKTQASKGLGLPRATRGCAR